MATKKPALADLAINALIESRRQVESLERQAELLEALLRRPRRAGRAEGGEQWLAVTSP